MNHDFVAPVYDLLARLWSGGAIDAARSFAPSRVSRGDRVLFAGVGAGRDASAATSRGAQVVGVDLSPRMLARASAAAGPDFEPRRADVRGLSDPVGFDLVCAHYFLNVFGEDEMPRVLALLVGLVRPGGALSIADFAPPEGRSGVLRALHYAVPLRVFAALGLCEPHPVYDYAPLLRRAGLSVEHHDFALFGIGPRWHRAWIARRPFSE